MCFLMGIENYMQYDDKNMVLMLFLNTFTNTCCLNGQQVFSKAIYGVRKRLSNFIICLLSDGPMPYKRMGGEWFLKLI